MDTSKIEDYCALNSSHIPQYLLDLERETNLKTINPRMLSGQLQGRVLSMISHMVKAHRILEIGTFTGYSGLCLAEGLQKGGILESIEVNREFGSIIEKYIKISGFEKKMRIYYGDALKVIDTLNGSYDLIFIDARKEDYIEYYEKTLPLLNDGGLILADNVLWSGKVFMEPEDETARQIHRFNRHVLNDSRTEVVVLPVRDGISLIRKL